MTELLPWLSAIVVVVGVVANYAVVRYRMESLEKHTEAAFARITEDTRSIGEQLKSLAMHSFSIAATEKALGRIEEDIKRVMGRYHRLEKQLLVVRSKLDGDGGKDDA